MWAAFGARPLPFYYSLPNSNSAINSSTIEPRVRCLPVLLLAEIHKGKQLNPVKQASPPPQQQPALAQFEDILLESVIMPDPRQDVANTSRGSTTSTTSYDIVSQPSGSPAPDLPWNQIVAYKAAEAGQFLRSFKFRGF